MEEKFELVKSRGMIKEIGTEDGHGLNGWYCDPLTEAEVMERPLVLWLLLLSLHSN